MVTDSGRDRGGGSGIEFHGGWRRDGLWKLVKPEMGWPARRLARWAGAARGAARFLRVMLRKESGDARAQKRSG